MNEQKLQTGQQVTFESQSGPTPWDGKQAVIRRTDHILNNGRRDYHYFVEFGDAWQRWATENELTPA